MRLYRHNRTWKAAPLAVERDFEHVIDELCKDESAYKKFGNDFFITELPVCKLDPGGMYNMKIPHKEFSLNGVQFDIQLSKIEEVLICMKNAFTNIDGYKVVPNWRYFVVLADDTFGALHGYLQAIEKSSDALHAELEDKITRDDLKSGGQFI